MHVYKMLCSVFTDDVYMRMYMGIWMDYLSGSNLSGSLHSSGLLCRVGDENSTYIPFFMKRPSTTQSSEHTREDLNQWENNIHISAFKTKLKAIRSTPIHWGQWRMWKRDSGTPHSIAHSRYFLQKHTACFIIMRCKTGNTFKGIDLGLANLMKASSQMKHGKILNKPLDICSEWTSG